MKKLSLLTLAAGLLFSLNGWASHHGEDTTEEGLSAPQTVLNLEKLTDIPMEMEEAVKEPIFTASARTRFQLDQMALMPFEGKLEKGKPLPQRKSTPSSGGR
jgi:hypothetical protein